MKRSVVIVIGALIAAFAVMGAAATLGVNSKKVDSFTADQAATTSTAPGDMTPPALVTNGLEMHDVDDDGKIDQILATFNEPLQASSDASSWTLSAIPSDGQKGTLTVEANSTLATLNITEGGLRANTAVGAFTVALAKSSTGIRDLAGNEASFTARPPVDKANPIPLTINIANGSGTNNKATQGDTVVVEWSEPLLASKICTSGFSDTETQTYDANDQGAIISVVNGSTSDSLEATFNCGSFRFGTLTLGSTAYTTATRMFAANGSADRSKATWAPSTATFTLTLGKLVGTDVLGTVNPPSPPAQAPTATYTPDPGLTDRSGNPAVGAATKVDTHF